MTDNSKTNSGDSGIAGRLSGALGLGVSDSEDEDYIQDFMEAAQQAREREHEEHLDMLKDDELRDRESEQQYLDTLKDHELKHGKVDQGPARGSSAVAFSGAVAGPGKVKCLRCGFMVKADGHADRCAVQVVPSHADVSRVRRMAWLGDALHQHDVRRHLLLTGVEDADLQAVAQRYISREAQAGYISSCEYVPVLPLTGSVSSRSASFEASYYGKFREKYVRTHLGTVGIGGAPFYLLPSLGTVAPVGGSADSALGREVVCYPGLSWSVSGPRVSLAGTSEPVGALGWRSSVADRLLTCGVVVITPRPPGGVDYASETDDDVQKRKTWEWSSMDSSDYILFNFLDGFESTVSFMELGLYAASRKLVVCCSSRHAKVSSVRHTCVARRIPLFENLDTAVSKVLEFVRETSGV